MKYSFITLTAFLCFAALCCTHETTFSSDDELRQTISDNAPSGNFEFYIMPASDDFQALPNQDPTNPINSDKVLLGKLLFHETGLALNAKKEISLKAYSCSTCHVAEKGFTPGRFQGIADGGVGFGAFGNGRVINPNYEGPEVDAQGARPLPTINLTYVKNALWSGAFGATGMNEGTNSIWGKADTMTYINFKGFEGLESNNHRALIVHRQRVDKEVCDQLGYTDLFNKAFPEIEEKDRYTLQIAGNAIAAYFRTILTNQAPFQKWLKGDEGALTEAQKNGANLFFGKAGCISCHNSPSFNGQKFSALGVKDIDQSGYLVYKFTDGRNKGRGGFTLKDEDLYKFKVPQLYNLKDIGFYFHGASKTSIRDVVKYFNDGIPENTRVPSDRVDSFIKPLGLSPDEVNDLTDFIENALHDPDLVRYKPSEVLSGNCIPNNDFASKMDMGCW